MPELSLLIMGSLVTALAVIACVLIGKEEAEDIRRAEIERRKRDDRPSAQPGDPAGP
jgi:hypothetical protein